MRGRDWVGLGLSVVGGWLAGCATSPTDSLTEGGAPLGQAELQALYEKAHDPRRHWITLRANDSGPVFEGAHRLHPAQKWSVPFKSSRKAPAPIVIVQGDSLKDVVALVDTSSAENWTDLESAQRMHLVPLGPPAFATRPVHVNDPAQAFLCVSERLRVGETYVETALFFVRNWRTPLEILDREFTDPHPQCVLGMRFLLPFAYAQFDIPARTFTLSTDQEFGPDSGRLVASVPYRPEAFALTVDGLLDGEPVAVVLDTGGRYGLAMANPTPDPRVLTLGDWTLEPMVAVDAAQLGLGLDRPVHLGLEFLAQYRFTLDHVNKLVHFESPAL